MLGAVILGVNAKGNKIPSLKNEVDRTAAASARP